MKIQSVFISAILALLPLISSAQRCTVPLNTIQFQQVKRNVSSAAQNSARLLQARNVVNSNCLSCSQLSELMLLFTNDIDRYEVASLGINAITDRENAYMLLDHFQQFSYAFHFYDLLNTGSISQPRPAVNPQLQPQTVIQAQQPVMTFPSFNYPDARGYMGRKNCASYLAENDFVAYGQDVFNNPNEVLRLDAAMALVAKSCLSTAQIMKLASLLTIENNRLELLKASYRNIHDEQNMDLAQQVFNHAPNRAAWNEYLLNTRNTLYTPAALPCSLPANQFQMLRETLSRESSSSSRLKIAKNEIPPKKCFTSQQMKEILGLFSSSSDRLDLAKFAAAYITDPDVYFLTVSSLFNSSSDRENLSNYLKK
jgi:hypothetical protein